MVLTSLRTRLTLLLATTVGAATLLSAVAYLTSYRAEDRLDVELYIRTLAVCSHLGLLASDATVAGRDCVLEDRSDAIGLPYLLPAFRETLNWLESRASRRCPRPSTSSPPIHHPR